MGAEGGGDHKFVEKPKGGVLGETIGNLKDSFNMIYRSMRGEQVTTMVWSDTPPETHQPDWIEKFSLGLLDFSTGIFKGGVLRELNHISDINLIRDKYYLTKAYIKSGVLRLNEYWDVLKPKRS